MTVDRPFASAACVTWDVPDGRLGPGVHVWRIDLDAPAANASVILAASELARANRIADAARRRRFLALRTAARRILARYANAEPHRLEFSTGLRGKPQLAHPPSPWAFNLTDSGALALLAVSDIGPLGIDVEAVRPVPRWERIAQRTFPASACLAIAAADAEEREALFLAHWTAHEARQKATGEGLHGARAPLAHWRVLQFAPGPGWIAALAVAADATPPLRWLDYPD